MNTIRVLIADDHEAVRAGLCYIVNSMPGFEVCGESSDGRQAVDKAAELKPNIAIVDLGLPILNGVDAIRQIRKRSSGTEVLTITGSGEEALIHQSFEAGARGFIFKTDSREMIQAALRALAEHKSYFPSKVGEVLFARFLHGKNNVSDGPHPGTLTRREREIVQLLAEGRRNKEVAAELGMSTKTAESHRAAIMKKLNLESIADLVRYAIRNHITSA
ncbi:MAG TPA: response regulator transcription factor [Chthoniobacteraceae bacterium]|jgi:DNA-binding NarL/FixJ family response regulator|nr:response regulator transcription factor [Chthoniobacteraceae bacterium]